MKPERNDEMKNPEISVIIPVYNAEETLRQCLESVLGQTRRNYEVIIADNNSTDGTKDIVQEFKYKNRKIKYVFESERGRGSARNAGIRIAAGEVIAMIDADCVTPSNWLDELVGPIISGEETAVMGSDRDIIENYWTRNVQKANQKFMERNTAGEYISHIDTKNFAIRASVIKDLLFDPGLYSFIDYDLFLRVKDSIKIRYMPDVKVGHYHKRSFREVVEVNFRRAYWTAKIYKKHGSRSRRDPMTQSISLYNLLTFPFWMLLQFIKKPVSEAYFTLVSEISWRAGLLWAFLK